MSNFSVKNAIWLKEKSFKALPLQSMMSVIYKRKSRPVWKRYAIHNFWGAQLKGLVSVPWYGCYSYLMVKMTIGKLAEMSGVGVETVRFYQRKELLREPKTNGTVRTYSKDDAQRIIFILIHTIKNNFNINLFFCNSFCYYTIL